MKGGRSVSDDRDSLICIALAFPAKKWTNQQALGDTGVYKKWEPEEEAKLTDAVKEHSDNNWVAVAALVPGRTNVQARARWLLITNAVVDVHKTDTGTIRQL
jgi:hypothetical protein